MDDTCPKAYTLKMRGGRPGGGKGPLIQTDKSGTLSCVNMQVLFQPLANSSYDTESAEDLATSANSPSDK